LVNSLPPFTGVDSTPLTKKLDDLSKKMLAQQTSDKLFVQAKSDIMSSRLNDSCQDAIEKFTTKANHGMKIKDAQMREWANTMLADQQEDPEEFMDSASSVNSPNLEFRIDGFKKQEHKSNDGSSFMSMIENFEKLQDTSCNEGLCDLREINQLSRKDIRYRTEVRRKESDFDGSLPTKALP
jgi:hypothetical protein